jgi:hypothetical protein
MSDTKLRALERRWKETGTAADEATYLLERVRVGDLTQERLELAAYCGHAAARRAAGSTAPAPSAKAGLTGLLAGDPEVSVRAALAGVALLAGSLAPAHSKMLFALRECQLVVADPTYPRAEVEPCIRASWVELRSAMANGTANPAAAVVHEGLKSLESLLADDCAEAEQWAMVALDGLSYHSEPATTWAEITGCLIAWALGCPSSRLRAQPRGDVGVPLM